MWPRPSQQTATTPTRTTTAHVTWTAVATTTTKTNTLKKYWPFNYNKIITRGKPTIQTNNCQNIASNSGHDIFDKLKQWMTIKFLKREWETDRI